MFCPKCGSELEENSKFCGKCGQVMASQERVNTTPPQYSNRPNRPNKSALIIGILCCAILLAAGGIGIAFNMNRNSPKTAVAILKKNIENGDYVYFQGHVLFTTEASVDKVMAKEFIKYLNNDKINLQDFLSMLSMDNYSNVAGKGNFFKKTYTFYIEPNYIQATTNTANTELYLNGILNTKVKASTDSVKIGPLLPMVYQVTAKNPTWKAAVSKEVNMMESSTNEVPMELSGTKKAPKATPKPTPAPTSAPTPKTIIIRENVSVPSYYESTDYILPDSDSTLYSTDYLRGLSKDTLRYARNEIYARYGRIFSDDTLQAYFNSKSWYYPVTRNDPELNSVESKNIERIKEAEASQ